MESDNENGSLAFENFKLAADQGYADGQFHLGVCYQHGRGIKIDGIHALKNYKLAADQGHVSAQFCVGVCYRDGIGIKKDVAVAFQFLNKLLIKGTPRLNFILVFVIEKEQG